MMSSEEPQQGRYGRLKWAILGSRREPIERFVLLVLLAHQGDDGAVHPSPALVAEETGLHVRTVQDTIRALCAAGWLTLREKRITTSGMMHVYDLTPPPGDVRPRAEVKAAAVATRSAESAARSRRRAKGRGCPASTVPDMSGVYEGGQGDVRRPGFRLSGVHGSACPASTAPGSDPVTATATATDLPARSAERDGGAGGRDSRDGGDPPPSMAYAQRPPPAAKKPKAKPKPEDAAAEEQRLADCARVRGAYKAAYAAAYDSAEPDVRGPENTAIKRMVKELGADAAETLVRDVYGCSARSRYPSIRRIASDPTAARAAVIEARRQAERPPYRGPVRQQDPPGSPVYLSPRHDDGGIDPAEAFA